VLAVWFVAYTRPDHGAIARHHAEDVLAVAAVVAHGEGEARVHLSALGSIQALVAPTSSPFLAPTQARPPPLVIVPSPPL
jgi:hypothetical protein